jgi:hypothetical protein
MLKLRQLSIHFFTLALLLPQISFAHRDPVGLLTTQTKAELDLQALAENGKPLDTPSRTQFSRHASSEPDAYGYIFTDSLEPDGPAFSWQEISTTGETLPTLADDSFSAAIDLGFSFPFYGESYSTIRVCSNGYFSFLDGSTDYENDPMPSANPPNGIIALFWDDLNPAQGGSIYTEQRPGQWICQFDAIPDYGQTGSITAQLILNADGSFLMQYLSFDGSISRTGESMGTESADGQAGLGISYNASPSNYPLDGLALRVEILDANANLSGTVRDGASQVPLEGVVVSLGGQQDVTDALGHYDLLHLYSGTALLHALASGYLSHSLSLELQVGANVQDLWLEETDLPSGLVGMWDFDQAAHLTLATSGNDLELSGSHSALDGPEEGDGAAHIPAGSFYRCYHDIAANGEGSPGWVNDFTLVMDVRFPNPNTWYCLYQTNWTNSNDGDCFINPSGQMGISDTGYSQPIIEPAQWYRLAISVSLGNHYDYYLDGQLLHLGGPQVFDGRFSLYPSGDANQVLFFADNNGEDHAMDVARILLFDRDLSSSELEELGGYGHEVISPEVPYMDAYLQSPTPTSLYVCWHSAASDASLVQYGTTESLGLEMTGDSHVFNAETRWHWVQLTGLNPDTEYFYRCVSDTAVSDTRVFRTQPEDEDRDRHLRFLVYGDTRTDFTAHRMVVDAMRSTVEDLYGQDIQNHVNLVFNVGDIVTTGSVLSQYQTQHFGPIIPLSNNIPYMVSIGNHEAEAAIYYDYMKYEDFAGPQGELYYSFRLGSIYFISLNSNTVGNTQLNWLDAELATSEADPSISMIFVFLHHPGHSEIWPDGNHSWVQDSVIPRIEAASKVEMLSYGHSHNYERGQQDESPMRLLLSGGGGSALDRWGMYGNQTNYPEISHALDHYCYTLIDVDCAQESYTAQTYSLGHTDAFLDNTCVDSWYHKRLVGPAPAPFTYTPNEPRPRPVLLCASPMLGDEGFHAAHYQVSTTSGSYDAPWLDQKLDAWDVYGDTGAPDYLPVNLNEGIDLRRLVLGDDLAEGQLYYWRVRYRDQNMSWTDWSQEGQFTPQSLLNHSSDFTADSTWGAAPLQVHFSELCTREPLSWQWDFDGDGSIDSEERDPIFTFTEAGLYTVSLEVDYGSTQESIEKVAFIEAQGAFPTVENLQIHAGSQTIQLTWTGDERFDHYRIYGAQAPFADLDFLGTTTENSAGFPREWGSYYYQVTGVWNRQSAE